MRPAALLTAAVATALVPVVTADAAPTLLRHLIADRRGDGAFVSAFAGVDITCADVVLGRKDLVATLTLAAAPAGVPLGGAEYWLGFTMGGTRMEFRMRIGTGLDPTRAWSVRVSDTAPKFTYQVSGNTLVWKLLRSDVPALRRPRLKATSATATTQTLGMTADSAATPGVCPA